VCVEARTVLRVDSPEKTNIATANCIDSVPCMPSCGRSLSTPGSSQGCSERELQITGKVGTKNQHLRAGDMVFCSMAVLNGDIQ
jgi:hypothetical protein